MLAWLPLMLAVAVFVIIHSHNQSLKEATVRHDADHDEDDGDDDCDCDADHDDFKTYHQLSNKTKVSQHSMLLQSHFPPFSSHIPELQAVAHNLLVYRSLNIPYTIGLLVRYVMYVFFLKMNSALRLCPPGACCHPPV